jgi:tetratricopeptide (TPR) repeat protein
MEEAGAAGLFEMQTEAMLELVAVYRYRKEYAVADQLLSRAAEFYGRDLHNEGYQRVIAARVQIALDNDDLRAAEAYLTAGSINVTSDNLGDLSPRLLMLAAEFALRRESLQDALRFAEAAQHGFRGDLPRLARLATLTGRIHFQLGHWQDAVDCMTWAIASMAETQDMLGHARARLNLALMFMARGKLRAALRYLRDLPADLEHLGDSDSLQTALHNLDLINQAMHK